MLRQPRPLVPFTFPLRRNWQYWLDVEFATAQASPIATYDGEVGTLVITDTGSRFSVSTNKLRWASSAAMDPAFLSAQAEPPRLGGVLTCLWNTAVRCMLNLNIGASLNSDRRYGLDQNGTVLNAIYFNGAAVAAINVGTTVVAATDYQIALVQRASGCYYFIKGGAFTLWTLVWVDSTAITAAQFAAFAASSGAGTLDYIRGGFVGAPFDTQNGVASVHQTPPSSGVNYTATADGLHQLTGIVLPGSPSANQIAVELRYNVLDASNYNTVSLKRNAGNSAWDCLFDTVAAGVSTNRATTTGVGTPDGLYVTHVGSLHDRWTTSSGVVTRQGGHLTQANQSTQANINATLNGATVTALDSYPSTLAGYAVLDGV